MPSWMDDEYMASVFDEQEPSNVNNPIGAMEEAASRQDMQQEWLSRSPAENVALLNAESQVSGIYGFQYLSPGSEVPEIPGMTARTFEVPGDADGGMYVGYESYEQTYARAKETYQSSGGGADADADYAFATRMYEKQKSEYTQYLEQHSDAPDYLRSPGNPVDRYRDYAEPVMQQEALYQKEKGEAMTDIDVSSVPMDQSYVGMAPVAAASMYENDNGERYGVRVMDGMDKETVDSLKGFQIPNDNTAITAEAGTDEYGQQVAARMKAMDEYLKSSDKDYQSDMPDNLQYYRDGENPPAIPGMTLVVGKIEGAPGYVAGYESYDETYQRSMQSAEQMTEGLSGDALTRAQTQADKLKENAASMYDSQSAQYSQYVMQTGNDFLDKTDPASAYQEYENKTPAQQKATTTYNGVVEWIKDGIQNIKEWAKDVMEKFDEPVPGELNEEQAMAASAAYWSKRASLEPENSAFTDRAMEANQANNRRNQFQDIVNSGTDGQSLYAVQGQKMPEPEMPSWGSTGNAMLDELNHGSTDTVDTMMKNMGDSGDLGYDSSLYAGGEQQQSRQTSYESVFEEPSQTSQKGYGTSKSRSRAEMDAEMDELAARIQRNGMEQSGMGMDGMSMHR